MKVTLEHIGVVSFGKLLAIWAFIIGILSTLLWSFIGLVLGYIQSSGGTQSAIMSGLFAGGGVLITGFIGAVASAVIAFLFGAVIAIAYNLFLGVGGGLDLDFKERK